VQEFNAEIAMVHTRGAELGPVADVRGERHVSPDVRAPAAPGTAVVIEPPDDPLAGLPGAPEGTPEELMDPVQRRIAQAAEEGGPGSRLRGDELLERARELDIEGRSSMSRDELREAVAEAEGEHRVIAEPDPQPKRPDVTEELGQAAAEVADPRTPESPAPEKRSGTSGAGGARVSPGLPEKEDEDEIAGTA
jgi:hypothetical protein